MGTAGDANIRLTKRVRQQLLDQNEGYTDSTYYEGRNFRQQRDYEIRNGELHVRSRGKTSWADSRFDEHFVADDDQTRRFLRNNLYALNTDGLDASDSDSAKARREDPADPTGDVSVDDVADVEALTDFEWSDDDESDDPDVEKVYAWVGGVLIAFVVMRAVAPRAKRWWVESLAPRAKRMRRTVVKGAETQDRDDAGVGPREGR